MSLFSPFSKKNSTLLVFHHNALQVLSFESGPGNKLLSFNEIELDQGLIRNGNITDMDHFIEQLKALFFNAKPHPVKAQKLFVNIPHHMLFSFVDDFSHRAKEESFKKAMRDIVIKHSPVPIDELALCFDSSEQDHVTSYAAYAAPKHWEDRLLHACRAVGAGSIEFVPEPLAYISFLGAKTHEDCIFVACHRKTISFSVFHNGLIYDSYQVASCDDDGKPDFSRLLGEYEKTEKDFISHFDSQLESLYFIGFDEDHRALIEDNFSEKGLAIEFVNTKDSKLASLISYEPSRLILFGLFNYVYATSR